MKPWNLKVKKIGRGYFFIALICCLFLTGTGELLTIMTPHSEKVVDVSVDEQNSTVINTRTVNHEGRWVFFMIFFVVLRWLYLIPLIIKRYHDAGYICGCKHAFNSGHNWYFYHFSCGSDAWGKNLEKYT